MPIIDPGNFRLPFLAYEAPVNEKTQQLRDKFKIDESGYPESYKWRPLSRLGSEYMPEDPFLKFDEYDPNQELTTKIFLTFAPFAIGLCCHRYYSYRTSRAYWSRIHYTLAGCSAMAYFSIWLTDKSIARQGHKNAIYIDYMRSHPERFGPIKRLKYREVLHSYIPCR